jgi:hypothetical protein
VKKIERTILIGIAFYMPLVANAGGWASPTRPTGAAENLDGTGGVIPTATTWILGFVILIAVLAIIWGGVQYLTSAGNQEMVKSGKDTIKNALIGLIAAGLAYAIVKLVVDALSGPV